MLCRCQQYCYCYCCCGRLELVVDPPVYSSPGCRVRLSCCMYPLEVSCRRGCCLANDARRKTCVKVEPAAPAGDQLVPNRRRRLPLTLPCVCFTACTQAAEEARSQTLLPPLYPFACLCLASSSESSIFLLFTSCICSSSRHSLDWPELYICIARTTTHY
jgi:hypothetical protein